MDTMKRYGRMWELDATIRFFLKNRDFKGTLSFLPLGIKLFMKGKLSLFPSFNLSTAREVQKIFKKVEEVEK